MALRILPVDPDGNVEVGFVRGQEEPARLGWRVYGKDAKPWNVPTYAWRTDGAFTKAWIIEMGSSVDSLPVESVETRNSHAVGEIEFLVRRSDGGTDYVLRRKPGAPPRKFQNVMIDGDLTVISHDTEGRERTRLEMKGGEDSVAASAGIPTP